MLAGYRSPFDATVVARLAEAGTVTLGKLNCDEFAMGSANENSAYGPVRNPWDDSARAGRLVGRLGRRGRGAAAAGRHRHRHRRLDPPAGQLLRRHRHQADLRRVLALRHDRLRLEPRPGRPAGAQRRGLRAAAVGDERLRRARLDQRASGRRRTSTPRCCRRARRRDRGAAAARACASACRRSSFPPALAADVDGRAARRAGRDARSSARRSSTSGCRAPSCRSRSTTSSRRPRRRRT